MDGEIGKLCFQKLSRDLAFFSLFLCCLNTKKKRGITDCLPSIRSGLSNCLGQFFHFLDEIITIREVQCLAQVHRASKLADLDTEFGFPRVSSNIFSLCPQSIPYVHLHKQLKMGDVRASLLVFLCC